MLLVAVGLFAASCKKEKQEATPSETAATAAAPAAAPAAGPAIQARQIFQTRCTVCHGADGQGTGPGAAALNPKPRNYTNAEWQKSVTDEDLKKIIVGGGSAVGKSPSMPANMDLESKPEVVDELVKIIRGFKRG
jgi:mono/diheme cytochrome c family protein